MNSDRLVRKILLFFLLSSSCGLASSAEKEEVADLLQLRPGLVVADVGAGEGEWSIDLARRVGSEGRVIATEVDPGKVEEIREAADREKADNLDALLVSHNESGLPADCCDRLFLRLVYHHFEQPGELLEQFRAALQPGGLMAIIDFPPNDRFPSWNVPDFRAGHGVPRKIVIEEVSAAGFQLIEEREAFGGRRDRYFLLFEKDH